MCIYLGVCVMLCVCVHVCVCVCVSLCVHAGVLTCVYTCGSQRLTVNISLYCSSPFFFRQGFLLDLEFAILARLVGYKPLVSARLCLHRLSTGVKGICHLTLTWVLEMQSQSQALMLI